MKVYDLSHLISPDMPVFPGTDEPRIDQVHNVAEDGFAEKCLTFFSHTGTHIDAPAHIRNEASSLDEFSIDQYCGRGVCLPVTSTVIDTDLITTHLQTLLESDFVLFSSGWDRYWGENNYFTSYPVLSQEAAQLLCRLDLKGVGFDTISADHEHSRDLPIHNILLDKMIIIENLTNLSSLPPKPFFFSCLPLRFIDADGCPVRAAAVFTDEGLVA